VLKETWRLAYVYNTELLYDQLQLIGRLQMLTTQINARIHGAIAQNGGGTKRSFRQNFHARLRYSHGCKSSTQLRVTFTVILNRHGFHINLFLLSPGGATIWVVRLLVGVHTTQQHLPTLNTHSLSLQIWLEWKSLYLTSGLA